VSTVTKFHSNNNALSEIAGGSAFILFGVLFGVILDYGIQVSVARHLGPSEYGLINLGFSILLVVTSLSLLGFHVGVTRYIAYYMAKRDYGRINKVIVSGLKCIVPTSIVFGTLLFTLRSFVANDIFKKPDLEIIIAIFAFTAPFFALAELFYACLRGFKKATFAVLSREICRRAITFAIVSICFLLGFGLKSAIVAYSAGVMGFNLMAFYYLNFRTFRISRISKCTHRVSKELFLYSWPLIFSFILIQINSRIGTILIGYFRGAEEVGLYNAALPLSQIISIFLSIVLFMFMPVMSELYSKSKYEQIKGVFKDITRWAFIPSCIAFVILFVFPEPVLCTVFGSNFIHARDALRILAFAFFVNAIFGPVGALLLAMGQSKRYFVCDVVGLSTSITLSVILIPRSGITGAAYAILVSMAIVNSMRLGFVYWHIKVHPFSLNYLKLAVPSLICVFR
jgi:O-antigen/teichoic acid export membrane protein